MKEREEDGRLKRRMRRRAQARSTHAYIHRRHAPQASSHARILALTPPTRKHHPRTYTDAINHPRTNGSHTHTHTHMHLNPHQHTNTTTIQPTHNVIHTRHSTKHTKTRVKHVKRHPPRHVCIPHYINRNLAHIYCTTPHLNIDAINFLCQNLLIRKIIGKNYSVQNCIFTLWLLKVAI